ncbi:MAG: hypothetical protein V1754_05840 [Pseudomonadota bacterium]
MNAKTDRITKWLLVGATLLGIFVVPLNGQTYESGTTHPGLTSLAVFKTNLHRTLRAYGLSLGLFSKLALEPESMDPKSIEDLECKIKRLDPSGGYRPNEKNIQQSLGWLLAGTVLADIPRSSAKKHFFNSENVNLRSADAFYSHLASSIRSPKPSTRHHHLALALMAMGNLVHVLQDMASPTHAWNDFKIGQFEKLGSSFFDRGSAYERFVALTYERLGLPKYDGKPISRNRLSNFFTNSKSDGLADLTRKNHFSAGIIPKPVQVTSTLDEKKLQAILDTHLLLGKSGVEKIDLACAQQKTCHILGPHGAMLAYVIDENNQLRFFLDQDCYISTARHLLPLAVGYSAGLIDFLLRAKVSFEKNTDLVVLHDNGVTFSTATVQIFWEDEVGHRKHIRTAKFDQKTSKDQSLLEFTTPKLPDKAQKLVALVVGKDSNGEEMVAFSVLKLEQ